MVPTCSIVRNIKKYKKQYIIFIHGLRYTLQLEQYRAATKLPWPQLNGCLKSRDRQSMARRDAAVKKAWAVWITFSRSLD